MKIRHLHCLHRMALKTPAAASLLFIHGGCATAACWEQHFLPWFSRKAYDCYAVDLSGHGHSEGRERLHTFSLDDYAQDVVQIAGEIEGMLVVVGHSMGCVVVERFLEQRGAHAAVLMSPVPATGILGATLNLACSVPAFFTEQTRPNSDRVGAQTLETIRKVYYSAETTIEDVRRFGPLFQEESRRALLDLSLLPMRIGRRRPRLPVLVIGGEADAVFPSPLLGFAGVRWQAEVVVVPRAGHTLMLDAHWQAAAHSISSWLARQIPQQGDSGAMA